MEGIDEQCNKIWRGQAASRAATSEEVRLSFASMLPHSSDFVVQASSSPWSSGLEISAGESRLPTSLPSRSFQTTHAHDYIKFSICSSFIYITPPYFHIGHGTIMGWLGLSILLSFFAMWDYNRINKQRDAYCAREGIDASRRAEFRDMGSESPLFRYVI